MGVVCVKLLIEDCLRRLVVGGVGSHHFKIVLFLLTRTDTMDELPVQMGDASIDITLEITRSCPLSCLICSSEAGAPDENELSLEKWIKTIDEAIELGTTAFSFSGGEPFHSSYFKDLCKHIYNQGIPFSVYTSGNLKDNNTLSSLKEEDFSYLQKHGITKLIFNLEGASKDIHDYMTQVKGSFNNTIASIKKATYLNISTEIHFVPTLQNYYELPEIISLSKKLGIKKVSVLRFVPQGRGKKNSELLKLSKEHLMQLKNMFDSILKNTEDYVRIGSPFNPFLLSKNYKCTAGKSRSTIRWDGQVFPCEAYKFLADDFQDNNLRKASLKDIWNKSAIFTLTRDAYKKSGPECRSCSYWGKCWGGCPAQKLILGSFNVLDPYCALENKIIQPITV